MDFKEIENPWSHYQLPDGTKIRIRHVLISVKHVGINEDGTPRYDLNFSAIAVTEPATVPLADVYGDERARNNYANALGVLTEMPLIKKTDLQ